MNKIKVTDPAAGEQIEVIDIQLYALNLAEDGRILSATEDKYGAEGQPRVAELPTGETAKEKDISNYKYLNGGYVYDPLSQPEVPEPEPTTEEILDVLLGMKTGGETDE